MHVTGPGTFPRADVIRVERVEKIKLGTMNAGEAYLRRTQRAR